MRILVSDIDNTLVPQRDPFNPRDMDCFKEHLRRSAPYVMYASGRYVEMVQDVIREYALPQPNAILSHVGTVITRRVNGEWKKDERYDAYLRSCWPRGGDALTSPLASIGYLQAQEPQAQSLFKRSYYVPLDIPRSVIEHDIGEVLAREGLESAVVYSVDQLKDIGLVDCLPIAAGKRGALAYLIEQGEASIQDIVFAGDSGNDVDALTMGCKGILVGNAKSDVVEEVRLRGARHHVLDRIYCAHEQYVRGVIEGAIHHGLFESF